MNKEQAIEKLAERLYELWRRDVEGYIGGQPMWATQRWKETYRMRAERMLKFIESFGYRLQPELKLISDEEIMRNYVQDSEFATGKKCAQAQLNADRQEGR